MQRELRQAYNNHGRWCRNSRQQTNTKRKMKIQKETHLLHLLSAHIPFRTSRSRFVIRELNMWVSFSLFVSFSVYVFYNESIRLQQYLDIISLCVECFHFWADRSSKLRTMEMSRARCCCCDIWYTKATTNYPFSKRNIVRYLSIFRLRSRSFFLSFLSQINSRLTKNPHICIASIEIIILIWSVKLRIVDIIFFVVTTHTTNH